MSTLAGDELLTGLQGGTTKNATPDQIRDVVKAVAATSTDGVILETSTAATSGAQKWSPRIRWKGFGWKTNATAASQSVEFAAEVQPVQGAAAPTGTWVLKASIEGGAYLNVMTVSSAGLLTIPDSLTMTGGALTAFNVVASNLITAGSGAGYAQLSSTRGYNVGNTLGYNFSSDANGNGTPDAGVHRAAANIIDVNNGTAGGGGAIRLNEMAAPSAPAANKVVIYAVDNGAGKTQLMALFPSGAAQQLAIEP